MAYLRVSLAIVVAVCFCLFVQPIGCDDDDEHDEALDEYFLGLLEGLRVIMPIGFEDFGIPVLEPLSIEKQELNLRLENLQLDLKVNNVTGEGFSSYKIPFLRVLLPNFKLRMTIVVPSFKLRGHYQANGTALYIVPIKGHGQFRVKITNLTIHTSLQMTQQGDKVVMRMLTLKGDLQKFDSQFDNLMSDGNLSLVLNNIIRTHATRFVGVVMRRVKSYVESTLGRFTDIVDSTIFEDFGSKKTK